MCVHPGPQQVVNDFDQRQGPAIQMQPIKFHGGQSMVPAAGALQDHVGVLSGQPPSLLKGRK